MKQTKRQNRRKLIEFLTSADQLLTELMKRKPVDSDKDIWLFSIIRDDPERPTWLERLQVYGPYDVAASQCAAIACGLPPGSIHRIESRRGEAAHRLLADGMRSEAKYRQERKAQPNN
jgi:hypothetical protein